MSLQQLCYIFQWLAFHDCILKSQTSIGDNEESLNMVMFINMRLGLNGALPAGPPGFGVSPCCEQAVRIQSQVCIICLLGLPGCGRCSTLVASILHAAAWNVLPMSTPICFLIILQTTNQSSFLQDAPTRLVPSLVPFLVHLPHRLWAPEDKGPASWNAPVSHSISKDFKSHTALLVSVTSDTGSLPLLTTLCSFAVPVNSPCACWEDSEERRWTSCLQVVGMCKASPVPRGSASRPSPGASDSYEGRDLRRDQGAISTSISGKEL